jgi:Kef-type K+ transport system membrane component KefB
MSDLARTLITIGGLLLVGFVADGLAQRSRLPRVTLLLVFGFFIGPASLSLLPDVGQKWSGMVTHMALVMVGFLLGGHLTWSMLRERGRMVLWISLSVVFATLSIVCAGLWLIATFAAVGVPFAAALVLAGVAPATDPAATMDVVHETNARGPFTRTLLGIVAIDDAWGLIVFSFVIACVQAVNGDSSVVALLQGTWEILGGITLGAALGVPMAYVTGRVQPGEPTLVEALGLVFLCGGLAVWLDVSLLLAAMTMGMVVANLATHHERPFHEIENIEWPFMIFFFVLSGASLEVAALQKVGFIAAAYIGLRIVSRLLGAWASATLGNAEPSIRRWMGFALMPQAGVALGMALVATQRFPELADSIMPVVIVSTILFEIAGPVCTRWAIRKAGEMPEPA